MNSRDNTTPDSLVSDFWDYRLERDKFWTRLRRFRQDAVKQDPDLENSDKLIALLEKNYGVRVHVNDIGQILPSYDVVDEASFTMFLLKYDR